MDFIQLDEMNGESKRPPLRRFFSLTAPLWALKATQELGGEPKNE